MIYDDCSKNYLRYLIKCRENAFGSSILPVWFWKRTSSACENINVWLVLRSLILNPHNAATEENV